MGYVDFFTQLVQHASSFLCDIIPLFGKLFG